MKIVINGGIGSFSLSRAACERLEELGFGEVSPRDELKDKRHDPLLVKVVEEMGAGASNFCARLIVVKFDDEFGDGYLIHHIDGEESVEYDLRILCRAMSRELTPDNAVPWRDKLNRVLAL